MYINITMTAICRPEVVRRTLESFCTKMLYVQAHTPQGDIKRDSLIDNTTQVALIRTDCIYVYPPDIRYRLFVNVDPVGGECKQSDIGKLCAEYFTEVHHRYPRKGHFGQAFHWTWMESSQHASDFTLHLEDDWELLRPVDITNMIRIFTKHPTLQTLRLSAFKNGYYWSKNWSHLIPWNGVFYEIASYEAGLLGFAGHPTLIRRDFKNQVAVVLDPERNPEKQIKGNNEPIKCLFQPPNKFGVYAERNTGPLIADIGTPWRTASQYSKGTDKANFTQYTKESKQ